jgi:hypothetical protein
MWARYYDSVIGRFYSNVLVGFRDVRSFNLYAYVHNKPYKYTDPDGDTTLDPAMQVKGGIKITLNKRIEC